MRNILILLSVVVLASCRTGTTATTMTRDSLCLSTIFISDTSTNNLTLEFDEMVVFPLSPTPNSKAMTVTNGTLSRSKRASTKVLVHDSIDITSERHTIPISPPPKTSFLSTLSSLRYLLPILLLLLIILIYTKKARH